MHYIRVASECQYLILYNCINYNQTIILNIILTKRIGKITRQFLIMKDQNVRRLFSHIEFSDRARTLLSTPEVRAAVSKVIIEWLEQFKKFTSPQDQSEEFGTWEVSYIPEGYAEAQGMPQPTSMITSSVAENVLLSTWMAIKRI